MSDQQNAAAKALAEKAVQEISTELGVQVDPEEVMAAAGMLLDVINKRQWREAQQAGDEAAAKITTADEAELAARNRK